jgi:hypothetical protein
VQVAAWENKMAAFFNISLTDDPIRRDLWPKLPK